MAEQHWEEYTPPIFPIGANPVYTMTFDFLQKTITFSRDALIFMRSHRFRVVAERQVFLLEVHPVYGTECWGAYICRNGHVQGAKDLMEWLRTDISINGPRRIELRPKNNGSLVGSYEELVSRRAASQARKMHTGEVPQRRRKRSHQLS